MRDATSHANVVHDIHDVMKHMHDGIQNKHDETQDKHYVAHGLHIFMTKCAWYARYVKYVQYDKRNGQSDRHTM